ncbi:MAG: patatin-like phospholipase family protein [Vicinamibacterales bacterium]|jgi:NTE family protein|nr:patatin-like phospholipase family protein [Vicinamibacterales bacterium]
MARRLFTSALAAALIFSFAVLASAQERKKVGVAFGGGSAKGIAHIGVIRWFEEHRIPIDVAAGTSMGGLIGGCFATGMSAAELDQLISTMDWDELFGSSDFAFKNIRRKTDARAYPSRLEFGVRNGKFSPPTSLNTGEQVDLMLARITGQYFSLASFDELPTPFRAVSVDLLSATQVVMDRGSLAAAMRATMSLPLIFPPVEREGKILVDGGAMNNVPADVARGMGADVVIGVNVGDLTNPTEISQSMFGLAGGTLGAMMRASTREGLAAADIVLNVPLVEQGFGSLAWRRSKELIEEGYKAAEAIKDKLLPYAVSEAEFQQWLDHRRRTRRTAMPAPSSVRFEGISGADAQRMTAVLQKHIGRPLDVASLEFDLTELQGLDRYEVVAWRFSRRDDGEVALVIRGRENPHAPPFLMLGLNLQNTTSDSFGVSVSARFLSFDVPFSGSELRLDGTVGSNPAIGAEWYQPLGRAPLFIAPFAGVGKSAYNLVEEDAVVARYDEAYLKAGLNVGVNLGAFSDVRLGAYIGRLDAEVAVGDPGLPAVEGKETAAELTWRLNTQDSPVIPSRGLAARVRTHYIFDGPQIEPPLESLRSSVELLQLETNGSLFHRVRADDRVFFTWGFGTSFDKNPLVLQQFQLGQPFRLGAYDVGQLSGDHYYVGTFGYLRHLARLPDFLGGPVFVGGWLENGDAFNDWKDAGFKSQAGVGAVADTLIGAVLVGGTAGFDGRWGWYISIGRFFAW